MERRSSRDDEPRSRGREDDRRGSSRDEPRRDDRGSSRSRDDEPRGRGREDDRGGSSRGRGGSGSSRGYEYTPRSVEDTKRRASQGANNFDKLIDEAIPNFAPADGDSRIRILPPTWKGAKHFAFDIWVHYGVGPDRQSYLDLTKMQDLPDPITEERERMRQERDPDEEYIKEIDSKRRAGIYLIDRDNEKEGVQFWAMPWTIDRDIVSVSVDRDSGEVLPIDHPEEGYDVLFTKTGKQKNTKYTGVSIARRSSPLGKSEWLDFAVDNPIPDKLTYFDYDHIAKAFGAKGASRDTRRDDEPRGRSSEREEPRRSSRDEPPARGSRRSEPDEPTWTSVHEMTATELDDLIEAEKLDIDPRDAKDDEDLADWICTEMGLKKEARRETSDEPRRRAAEPEPEDKLADMRRRREADDEPRRSSRDDDRGTRRRAD